MADLRPDIGPALALFGVPATVILPDLEVDAGDEPIATTAIWLPPVFIERGGVLAQGERPLPILALPRSDVPDVPRGTRIQAAEYAGGPVKSWMVELVIAVNWDEIRVVLIPAQAADQEA